MCEAGGGIVMCEAGVDIVMCCNVLHDPRLLHAPHPQQQGPVPRGPGAHL